MSSEHTFLYPTAQTDSGIRSRTFSLKINELPTCSEINQGWQYRPYLYCQIMSTFTLCSKP